MTAKVKPWRLPSQYDDSDPYAKTLESEILEKQKISRPTLYAHLPAKQFPREDGYILGIKLLDDEEDLGVTVSVSQTPVFPINLEDLEVPEKELISASEPAVSQIYSISDLKDSARELNNKVAEKYKSLSSSQTGKKKEAFPDWFKSHIWRKYNSSLEKVLCPICSDTLIGPDSFSAGHILPESKGGMMCSENVMPICPDCNSQMGARHLYWFAWHYYGKVLWSVY